MSTVAIFYTFYVLLLVAEHANAVDDYRGKGICEAMTFIQSELIFRYKDSVRWLGGYVLKCLSICLCGTYFFLSFRHPFWRVYIQHHCHHL